MRSVPRSFLLTASGVAALCGEAQGRSAGEGEESVAQSLECGFCGKECGSEARQAASVNKVRADNHHGILWAASRC